MSIWTKFAPFRCEAADGFPEDFESIVRDNAASLRITNFGFEGE